LNFNPISGTNVGGGVCQYLGEEIEETTNAEFFSFSHGFPGRVQLTLVISWIFNFNVTFFRQMEKQWICKTTLVQCCCAVLALLNRSNYSSFKDVNSKSSVYWLLFYHTREFQWYIWAMNMDTQKGEITIPIATIIMWSSYLLESSIAHPTTLSILLTSTILQLNYFRWDKKEESSSDFFRFCCLMTKFHR